MILFLLIFIPLIGAFFAWKSEKIGLKVPRFIALFVLLINFFLLIKLFYDKFLYFSGNARFPFFDEISIPWIKFFGINFHLGIDILSFLMIFLTIFLSLVSILLSWNENVKNIGCFYFLILLIVSNIMGIFLSLDLFLFFTFLEIVCIPIYFLMIYWGRKHEDYKNCSRIANEYLIYSQLSGCILFISILGIAIHNYHLNYTWSFDFRILHYPVKNLFLRNLLICGFLVSFFIKMPIFPFHSWFPNFHKNTPISGSFDLIGILIKTSLYGILRFIICMFPDYMSFIPEFFRCLGLFCIFYGIFIAFSQKNIKKIIAYTSISHMGYILIAIYSQSDIAISGILIQILSYSLSTTGLIILTRILYRNFKTYNFQEMMGLWDKMPYVPGFFLFFIMSNLGIPGTGNFVGEYLMLLGGFENFPIITSVSMIGLIFLSVLFLGIFHKIFYGVSNVIYIKDQMSRLEFFILSNLVVLLLLIGIFPNFLLQVFTCFHFINISRIILIIPTILR
ncbi:complex I subunit 4 family protein [Buchnera aphidicola]|uniref:complex I subunit 4 family protein n=1 Tax=Buchnera aphidicola TaxID=9 RepID=UPI002092E332|nr:NADH-quinone oxidoreductase subunit M [Buchnera aphidicola]USS94246.1 NADH-quinone oxidoreductase subunit M [Buchnera aphidicola (Sipha maydis)]